MTSINSARLTGAIVRFGGALALALAVAWVAGYVMRGAGFPTWASWLVSRAAGITA